MDTSDDPATLTAVVSYATIAAAGTTIYTATQGRGGAKRIGTPEAKTTAEPIAALSEQAKRNRRLAASSLTRQFAEPTLGTLGLLGL